MAIKDILLHIDTSDRGSSVSDFAISLATELGAHLTAAGVVLEIVPPASFMGEYPYDIMAEAIEQAREAAEEHYKKLAAAAPATNDVKRTRNDMEARLQQLWWCMYTTGWCERAALEERTVLSSPRSR